jgi:hypothetical protein
MRFRYPSGIPVPEAGKQVPSAGNFVSIAILCLPDIRFCDFQALQTG